MPASLVPPLAMLAVSVARADTFAPVDLEAGGLREPGSERLGLGLAVKRGQRLPIAACAGEPQCLGCGKGAHADTPAVSVNASSFDGSVLNLPPSVNTVTAVRCTLRSSVIAASYPAQSTTRH